MKSHWLAHHCVCAIGVRSENCDCDEVRDIVTTCAATSNFFTRVQVTLLKFDTTVTQKKTPQPVA